MTADNVVATQGSEAAFPRQELEARLGAAREALVARGIDVYIITGPENIFYLCGQQTPGYYTYQALILPVDGEPVFIVRQLELNNLIANSYLDDVVAYDDGADAVDVTVDLIRHRGWQNRRLAIDERGWFLPIAVYKALLAALGETHDGAGVIESLRRIKSPLEIEKLEIAAGYTDAGMAAGVGAIAAGASENDLVAAMMGAAIAAGSEYVGMEPLVSTGPRSGIPHGTWRRRIMGRGDPVFLEQATCHDRYHATLMRSAWIGPPPKHARRMMDCCLEALAAALDAARPGATCESVHRACQRVVDAHGFTDAFRKRTGYSIGVSFAPDWGEGNVLSLYEGVTVELEPGMAFHAPPALRRYGEMTVGVSESFVITGTGAQVLGTTARDMVVVD